MVMIPETSVASMGESITKEHIEQFLSRGIRFKLAIVVVGVMPMTCLTIPRRNFTTIQVVGFPLLRICEHGHCIPNSLESFSCPWSLILIRMQVQCELLVGFSYLTICGIFGNSQHLVETFALFHFPHKIHLFLCVLCLILTRGIFLGCCLIIHTSLLGQGINFIQQLLTLN
uniref:Uncharacterized protein n=1 Tax=Lutzomyia longipalpis TaxID=7200 RepID=A0A7G3B630_LUTLO